MNKFKIKCFKYENAYGTPEKIFKEITVLTNKCINLSKWESNYVVINEELAKQILSIFGCDPRYASNGEAKWVECSYYGYGDISFPCVRNSHGINSIYLTTGAIEFFVEDMDMCDVPDGLEKLLKANCNKRSW